MHVFISYAREDIKDAQKLYHALKQAGVTVWMDKEDLLVGQNWKVAIRNAIHESSFFLALLSSNSLSKQGFVQKELKIALEFMAELPQSESFILPVRLDECVSEDEVLRERQWVDLFESYENGLKQILRVVKPEKLEKEDSRKVSPSEISVHKTSEQEQEQEQSINHIPEKLAEIVDVLKKGDTSRLKELSDYSAELIKSALEDRNMDVDGDGNIVSRDLSVGDGSIVGSRNVVNSHNVSDSHNISGNVFISVQEESPELATRLAELSSQFKADISDLKKEISELRERQAVHEERQRQDTQDTQESSEVRCINESGGAEREIVPEEDQSKKILPVALNRKIVDFLTSLPNIHDGNRQQALIYSAGLDTRLQNQIRFNEPVEQFFQLLVSTSKNYGILDDGRDALRAVLEAAKESVGIDRQEECDRLIEEYETFLQNSLCQSSVKSIRVSESELPQQSGMPSETLPAEADSKIETDASEPVAESPQKSRWGEFIQKFLPKIIRYGVVLFMFALLWVGFFDILFLMVS